jgi:ABC-type amino acid transport substrate-binding protein
MIRFLLAAVLTVASIGASIGAASAQQTLAQVKARGTLICGVSQGFAGFSAPDSRGEYRGLDVDYCKAVAAAVLGDASKVRFVPLTAQARFTALQTGEIDVLFRNSTQTFLRDTSLGLRQGPVNFYDGQGFAVRRDARVANVAGLNGATINGRFVDLNAFSVRGVPVPERQWADVTFGASVKLAANLEAIANIGLILPTDSGQAGNSWHAYGSLGLAIFASAFSSASIAAASRLRISPA